MGYATHLSPKEYTNVELMGYNAANILRMNYAKRIAKSLRVDHYKLEQVYSTVYGRDWQKQSYAKLRSLAKALPKYDKVELCYYTPEHIKGDAIEKYRTRFTTLDQTYAYRRAVRVFGKKRIAKSYASNDARDKEPLARAVLGYKLVRDIDGRTIADAMKDNMGTLSSVAVLYRQYTTRYDNKLVLEGLPEAMQDDIRALAKEVAVRNGTRSIGMSNWAYLATKLLDNVTRYASSVQNDKKYKVEEKWLEKDTEKLSKAIANVYEMLELDKALNTIGLCLDRNASSYNCQPKGYSNTKLDYKMVRAIKAVLATNYDDKAKRDMVFRIYNKLADARYDDEARTSWLPLIARCAEEAK